MRKTPEKPLLSPGVFKQVVVPRLQNHEKILFILIDNLRLDQWKAMAPIFAEHLNIASEDLYCSILPTCTHYARNALFSGLMPLEIMKHHPDLWKFEDEPGSKNIHEGELLKRQLTRLGMNIPFRYEKVGNLDEGHKLVEQWQDMKAFPLNVVVYNFVDMVSHARTEVEMIKELAADEPAFRSLSLSWFRHSSLLDLIREISSEKFTLILTTDHGSIRVNNPIKVVGDRESSTNLRYKTGKNLNYNPREVFEVFDPEKIHLPKTQLTSRFIFARNDNFMVFPKNFNYYAGFFRNTFQHGGISLEEMMVPLVVLTPVHELRHEGISRNKTLDSLHFFCGRMEGIFPEIAAFRREPQGYCFRRPYGFGQNHPYQGNLPADGSNRRGGQPHLRHHLRIPNPELGDGVSHGFLPDQIPGRGICPGV